MIETKSKILVMVFRLLLVLTIFSYKFVCIAQNIPYQYTIYNSEVSSNKIYGLETDKKGYLWIAGEAGLIRFDGYRFTNIPGGNGLPIENLINLYYNPENDKLHPLTLNGKIFEVTNTSLFPFHSIEELYHVKNPIFYYFDNDKKEQYWLGPAKSLINKAGNIEVIEAKSNTLIKILEKENCIPNKHTIDWRKVRPISNEKIIENINIPTVTNIHRIGKYNSLILKNSIYLNNGHKAYEFINFEPFKNDIEGFIVDFDIVGNDLYIAYYHKHGGIFKLKNYGKTLNSQDFERISKAQFVNSITADKLGNIWYSATNQGLFYINKSLIDIKQFIIREEDGIAPFSRIKALSDTQFILETQYAAARGSFGGKLSKIMVNRETMNEYNYFFPLVPHNQIGFPIDISNNGKTIFFNNRIENYSENFKLLSNQNLTNANFQIKVADAFNNYSILISNEDTSLLLNFNTNRVEKQFILPSINDLYYHNHKCIILASSNGLKLTDTNFLNFVTVDNHAYTKIKCKKDTFYFFNDRLITRYEPNSKLIETIVDTRFLKNTFSIIDLDISDNYPMPFS